MALNRNIRLSEEQKNLLEQHLKLVLEANKNQNLTSIRNIKEAQVLHVEDSLALAGFIAQFVNVKLLDMGSGAGFPGIPLSIALGCETHLCETVRKKSDCLKTFIDQLKLNSHVFVSNKRLEELANEKRGYFNIVTARALSSLPSLLELASPLTCINGYFIAYKSDSISDELRDAKKICNKLGFEFVNVEQYYLSNNIKRTLVIFKKTKESHIKLPRKLGLAQKRPLI